MTDSRERIAPLTHEGFADRVRAASGGAAHPAASSDGAEAGPGAGPPNILRTVAHHPTLLVPFLQFAAALAIRGVLPRRESELLALRAAWNCRSAFEWGHHVLYARDAGMSEEEITRIVEGSGAAGWSSDDRALLRAADELHEQQEISDATWADLSARWDTAQLVEIPFVVGNYTMLSMVARSTAVPLETDLPPLPDR